MKWDGVERRKTPRTVCQEHSGLTVTLDSIDRRLETIEKRTECLPVVVEKAGTNRSMIYSCYALMVVIAGWIYYHLNGK